MKYAANITGLLALAFTLLTYSIPRIPELSKSFKWVDEVTIIDLDTGYNMVILNTGAGTVVLKDIVFSSEEEGRRDSLQLTMMAAVKPGTLFKHEFSKDEGSWVYLSSITDEAWSDAFLSVHREPCLQIQYLLLNGTAHSHVQEFLGPKLRTFPAKAEVNFFSLHHGEDFYQTVSAVGVVRKNRGADCD